MSEKFQQKNFSHRFKRRNAADINDELRATLWAGEPIFTLDTGKLYVASTTAGASLADLVQIGDAVEGTDVSFTKVVTADVQASSSAGGHLQNLSGSDVLGWGEGGGINGTLYGGWNYDNATANTLAYYGGSKTLSSAAISSNLTFSSGTLDTVQNIQTNSSVEFNSLTLNEIDSPALSIAGNAWGSVHNVLEVKDGASFAWLMTAQGTAEVDITHSAGNYNLEGGKLTIGANDGLESLNVYNINSEPVRMLVYANSDGGAGTADADTYPEIRLWAGGGSSNESAQAYIRAQHESLASVAGTNLQFHTRNSGFGSVTEKMRIDASGQVGLGITPSYKIHAYEASATCRIQAQRGSGFAEIEANSSGGAAAWTNTSGTPLIQFRTYGDSYFNGGDFGLGQTNPAAQLHVSTSTTEGHEAIIIDQNDADQPFIDFQGSLGSGSNSITTNGAGASSGGVTGPSNSVWENTAMIRVEINGAGGAIAFYREP